MIKAAGMRANGLLRIAGLAFLTLLCGGSAVFAEQIAIDLDPAKTTISFVLSDVLHTVHGTFRSKSGSIQIDPAANRISGTIIVDAASGDSGGGLRDKRMKREFLEVERYPEISFTPIEIEGLASGAQSSQATVTGWFAIHGQKHKITFPVQIERVGADVSATGNFVVPYVAWGIKDPSTFLLHVNDKVDVSVRAVGHVR